MTIPVLHFQGHFRFHMPEYNNGPRGQAVPFDPNITVEEVTGLCGCDPARYFEFDFEDTSLARVTGAPAESVGASVALRGFLPDVSPSAICSQLFAGQLEIPGVLSASVARAIQSQLRLNVRSLGFTDESAAAHFDAPLEDLEFDPGFVAALGPGFDPGAPWEFHMHLNRYTRLDHMGGEPDSARLTGQVFGYLRQRLPGAQSLVDGRRTIGRTLVAADPLQPDSGLGTSFYDFAGRDAFGPPPDAYIWTWHEIDMSYDLDVTTGQVHLRPLHGIPYLGRDRSTPTSASLIREYRVQARAGQQTVVIGTFAGDHDDLVSHGGVYVFDLPEGPLRSVETTLEVLAVDATGAEQPLFQEAEIDLVLEGPRGHYLGSSDSIELQVRAYRANQPADGVELQLVTQPANPRSPVVASFASLTARTASDGVASFTVNAIDLTNTGGIEDPVDNRTYDSLPTDRNYGNFLHIRVPNTQRKLSGAESVELSVRVLHKATIPAGGIVFSEHIAPLFAYHVRYFPWLHTRLVGQRYVQFVDLGSEDDVLDNLDLVIDRIEAPRNARAHMPRSRDLPIGALALLEAYRDQV